jgi:HD-like signal output (HDOD) protein
VARQWNLPAGVVDAMRYHHGSAACPEAHRETVQCVELANYVCSAKGHSSVGLQLVKFPGDVVSAFALRKEDFLVIAEDFDRELSMNSTLFQL